MRKLLLSIESRLDNVALAACCIRGLGVLTPLAPEAMNDVELGVVEALTNVIQHGYAGEPWHTVQVIVILQEDRLGVEIYDTGQPLDPALLDNAGLPDTRPDDFLGLPEGGWGLHLIKTCLDEVRYATQGGTNVLSLGKYFPRPAMA